MPLRTLALMLAISFPALAFGQAPAKVGYQGRLLKSDGSPEAGTVSVTFSLFADPTGGSAIWTETQSLALSDGYYATFLGSATALDPKIFDGRDLYLELGVSGAALSPRQRIGSVPYALACATSGGVSGGAVNATSISVGGNTVFSSSGQCTVSSLSVGSTSVVDSTGHFVGPTDNLPFYSKTDADARYAAKTDLASYYTHTDADAKFATKTDLAAFPPANTIVANKGSASALLNPGDTKTVALAAAPAQLFTNAWASYDAGASWRSVPVIVQTPPVGYGTGRDGSPSITGSFTIDNARTKLTAAAAPGANSVQVAAIANFAQGQLVLVVQVQGGMPGTWEVHRLSASPAGTSLAFAEPLRNAFAAGAVVLRVPEYTDVTVPVAATLTASPWDGSTGGIVAFAASGTVTVYGTISASGIGFRGGIAGPSTLDYAFNQAGEGQSGPGTIRSAATSGYPNGVGGGAGCGTAAGGGGGGAASGLTPNITGCACGGIESLGGAGAGVADAFLLMGGGGGASGSHSGNGRDGAPGGAGGGIVFIAARNIVIAGQIAADGAAGADGYVANSPLANYQPIGGGGGGGGGTVHVETDATVLGGRLTAAPGAGGRFSFNSFAAGGCNPGSGGGAGGAGRVVLSRPASANATPQAVVMGAGSGAGVLVGIAGASLSVTSVLPQTAQIRLDYAY